MKLARVCELANKSRLGIFREAFPKKFVEPPTMARLQIQMPESEPADYQLPPGCYRVGREGDKEILLPHHSVSRDHCEIWVMDDAVMVRDLESRNGTVIDGERVTEAPLLEGQTLHIGDVELLLTEGPARISVPDLPLPARPKQQLFMEDGTPCCLHHSGVAAKLQCTKCSKAFCASCVRELRVAGGMPRSFCPECGGSCGRVKSGDEGPKRATWLDKIRDAFTKPARRP